MKIYSNTLTRQDVQDAFAIARGHGQDIRIRDIREWNPRRYAHGTEVWGQSLHGQRAAAHGGRAASWDAWGFAIAALFRADPRARVGWYVSKADFVTQVNAHPRAGSSLAFLGILSGTDLPLAAMAEVVPAIASCGHPADEDGECLCEWWPDLAPDASLTREG